MLQKIIRTDQASTTVIIRIMLGAVFLSEGIQKFLFPGLRGAGRFEKIGLPAPEFLGNLVGFFEILCGILILLGLLSRGAALITLIIMLVAMASTKSMVLAQEGFWPMLHSSRTDWSMLLASLFLIIKGGGKWSLDQKLTVPQKSSRRK